MRISSTKVFHLKRKINHNKKCLIFSNKNDDFENKFERLYLWCCRVPAKLICQKVHWKNGCLFVVSIYFWCNLSVVNLWMRIMCCISKLESRCILQPIISHYYCIPFLLSPWTVQSIASHTNVWNNVAFKYFLRHIFCVSNEWIWVTNLTIILISVFDIVCYNNIAIH